MAWKFGGIYFKENFSQQPTRLLNALQLELSATGENVNLSQATSVFFDDTAIGYHKDCTLLHDNFLPYDCAFEADKFFEFDQLLADFSNQTEILCFF
ncbi:MAG: hypothetical protein HC880_03735 [Bacteroidia bacterium]|nr:hypothetical protein [Bacteroidia bacterium]